MSLSKSWVVAGTDTGIGKTVFSALLTKRLDGVYWKPIQAGFDFSDYGLTDKERVQKLTGLHPERNFYPEAYVFEHSLSPYAASEIDGVNILTNKLQVPKIDKPLIIEGAGGLMVPLSKKVLQIDVFQSWNVPLILCARTALGTMNHTLLSIEAIQKRNIPLLGIVFIGEKQPFTEEFIVSYSGVKKLGTLPLLNDLEAMVSDKKTFDQYFNIDDFQSNKKEAFHSSEFAYS